MAQKSKTAININPDPVIKANNKGLKNSSFLLTINPNKKFDSPTVPEAKELILDLRDLSDFILLHENVIKSLLFFENEEGQPEKTLEEHLASIVSIDDDSSGVVEYGQVQRKLHAHLYFTINHKTRIQLDRGKVLALASEFLGVDPSSLNVSFIGGKKNAFLEYVKKYNKANGLLQDEFNQI